MNERIKQILNDSGLAIQHDGIVLTKNITGGEALTKFAEAIVDECAYLANENAKLGTPQCGQKVRRHFGVE